MTVLDTTVAAPGGAPALPLLSLTEPMPGFPDHRDYALVPADGQGRLHWLLSLGEDGPRFLTVAAPVFFPGYSPALPPAVRSELDLADDAEPQLYCLVTVPGGDAAAATANLRAPLAVNLAAGLARQVVLPDVSHPIRRPLRR